MVLSTLLLIGVALLLVATIPVWAHSAHWGYGPSGGMGLVLLVVLVLLFTGRL
jgi:hypothetical protein